MVATDTEQEIFVVDTSPLIYLAKVDAFDVLPSCGRALIPPAVRREAIMPARAFRFPEIIAIESAIERGELTVTTLDDSEVARAASLDERAPGLGAGEREAIAVSMGRSWPVVLSDRRARGIARALRLAVIDPFQLLFRGTADADLLEDRVRALAELVELRVGELSALLHGIEQRRRR